MRVVQLVLAVCTFFLISTGDGFQVNKVGGPINPKLIRADTSVRLSDKDFSEGGVEKATASTKMSAQEDKNSKRVDVGDCYINRTPFDDGTKPQSVFLLAINNFLRQGSSILVEAAAAVGITGKGYIPRSQMPPDCLGLTLDSEAVKEAERKRESRKGEKVETNPASRLLYDIGCFALDELFPTRPIARFWFLETIARIPYFSYVSMLHLYESFGWWREPELRKIHYAQEYNELHHLLIMEALGGNSRWRDRFLGYHVAFGYYWAVNTLFLFSPKAAYEFMELLEAHAVDTYTTFFRENEDRLKSLPAPNVAKSYYKAADLYMFDEFQISKRPNTRRPPCDNLYDVFKNISEDEGEHVRTMRECKDYARIGDIVVSPHQAVDKASFTDEKRQAWLDWSEEVNRASCAEEDF